MWEVGVTPTVVCYGSLVTSCAKVGDVNGAERWLNELCNSGVGKPNTICVNMVISASAKCGDLDAFLWAPYLE